MSKLLKAIYRTFSSSPGSTGSSVITESEEDLRADYSNNNVSSRLQYNPEKGLNTFYNDVQIFDAEHGVTCVRVLNSNRIAAGLTSGKVNIWDTAVGRLLHSLHNHKRPIKLLEVVRSSNCVRLVSAGEDELITLWDVDTGAMLRCFRHCAEPNIRFIHDVSRQHQVSEQVTLLCGRDQLAICQLHHHHQETPVSFDSVSRQSSDQIVEILIFLEHVVCVSDKTALSYKKNWDSKGKLVLEQVNVPLESTSSEYTCAAAISDEMFAVGAVDGDVYICKVNHDSEQMPLKSFHPDVRRVTRLQTVNEIFLAVVYSESLHIVHIMSEESESYQGFTTPIIAVVDSRSMLVTACENSSRLSTWDLHSVIRDGGARDTPRPLESLGDLLLSESDIKGVEVMSTGLVTYGTDSLVLVWRNKYEEMLRLLTEVQQETTSGRDRI